jgi:hypothetical protein
MLYVLIASFYAVCFIIFVRRNSSSSFHFPSFLKRIIHRLESESVVLKVVQFSKYLKQESTSEIQHEYDTL